MSVDITIGSLFSGVGGLELGLHAGFESRGHRVRTLWQVEQNEYCRRVLARHWPHARKYEDVREITRENAEPVDILCGGFPCQDISTAGLQAGLDGERSGLFYEMSRIVREIRPKIWIMENVANLVNLGLSDVLREVADCGYDARWGCLRASDVGAPHQRNRWFCVAWLADAEDMHSNAGSNHTTKSIGQKPKFRDCDGSPDVANTQRLRQYKSGQSNGFKRDKEEGNRQANIAINDIERTSQSGVGGDAHGFPRWVDIAGHRWAAPPGPQPPGEPPRVRGKRPEDRQRLKALGNAVVPQQIIPVALWVSDHLIEPK